MNEWQSILTAPKDGRFIILTGKGKFIGTPPKVEVCRWDRERGPKGSWVNDRGYCFEVDPLYWIPLSEIPSTSDCKDEMTIAMLRRIEKLEQRASASETKIENIINYFKIR